MTQKQIEDGNHLISEINGLKEARKAFERLSMDESIHAVRLYFTYKKRKGHASPDMSVPINVGDEQISIGGVSPLQYLDNLIMKKEKQLEEL